MDSNVENFANLDIRVGQILSAEVFEEAKKPAYILKIDFGNDIGIKKTSAQITNYQLDELVGVRCIGVINLGDKQIGPIISQCLILGSINENGDVLLLQPSPEADLGDKVS
ncbi:MAG: tRNA-binding protein [Actinomycetota bacterium]|jgi:tRNA-binding protein|nr:tRNA-binding protein [Actinomycetota bacterium]MDA9711836.1 tRNA-binding protein [Acidimicrobiaceae bacterium]RDX33147.1 tRNA-binding protein [Candidatus Actinomarina sp. HD9-500m-PIT-SAG01]MEC7841157.1 tRNA-binding protein [Actinomycetota bacterium]MED5382820.1 tRNA-binding protein [Actinomycetota bacterium]|tara:strand:+ start:119 stop:451 length:333 start_codon:yes stop_codon:yes gene_type:complete